MVTIIAEVVCNSCEVVNNYIIEDLEELLDIIAEDGWIVKFDTEGNITNTYCCLECKEDKEFKDSEDDFVNIAIEDEEWEDELSQNGMHIEVL